MDKYCRICWNTKNWKQPTGEAQYFETGGSYVAENGFGHEEWLFNFSWLLTNQQFTGNTHCRYGFLQPIGKYYNKYMRNTFSALLYTRSPEGKNLLVAQINNLYVPDEQELTWALSQIVANGWVSSMQSELDSLGIDYTPLINPNPRDIANVRFSLDDVTFFDPRTVVDPNHKISKSSRYHPFNWDDPIPQNFVPQNLATPPINQTDDDDPTRSEEGRTRAAVEATIYDPRHVKLQNTLYRKLCYLYGQSNVQYEADFVDLILNNNQVTIFIEIKTYLSAKRCIREAIGQLLEYSHYPRLSKAHELLVVGDAKPTCEDRSYLAFLRRNYNLPIKYSRWSWSQNDLEPSI